MSNFNKKAIYFENLEGWRFFSFLAVFLFHSFHTNYSEIKLNHLYIFLKGLFKNGSLGVNFFFVLSGFLITYLLIQEKKQHATINIKKFYLRRILRIWPLFYFCVFFGFLIFPILKNMLGQVSNETANIYLYLTFLNSFDLFLNGLADCSTLGVLWSVSIEEQYYLVCPLILYLLPISRYKLAYSMVIAISLVFRSFYLNSPIYLEYHTLSCIGDLAVGGICACWASNETNIIKINNWSKYFIIGIYLLVFILFFTRQHLHLPILLLIFERLIIAILFGLIILEQNFAQNSFFKMKQCKWATNWGKYTYGLYCLQFIGILIAITITNMLKINTKVWQVFLIDFPLSFGITMFLAYFSYHFYEQPFLKLKNRFKSL